MEKQVLFRDFQKAQTSDFNNLQDYVQQSFDDLINDAVTGSLRYSGFNTVKSNTAEITVSPGRFYGANQNSPPEIGAVYTMPTQSVISLVQYLAVSTQLYLTLAVYGVVDNVDIQTRDYLINTTTLQTEPQAVAMTSSRDAVLAIIAGAESANPNPPTIGTSQVAVANILMDTTGVVSVTMLPTALVTSTEVLNGRLLAVENFDAAVESQVSTLTSDLAALAALVHTLGPEPDWKPIVTNLVIDMALVKAELQLPSNYSYYSGSYFMFADVNNFDINNTQALGFNCYIDKGLRFPWQNADFFALAMFNSLDPNGILNSTTGILLPAYTEIVKIQTGTLPTTTGLQYSTYSYTYGGQTYTYSYGSGTPAIITDTVALGQYGYQTISSTTIDIPYTRIQNGGSFMTCSNGYTSQGAPTGNWVNGDPAYPNGEPSYLPDFSSYDVVSDVQFIANPQPGDPGHTETQYDFLNISTYDVPYTVATETDHTINGALIAQTLLVSSDAWITRIGLWFATVVSATDVILTLCECTNGVPDLTKCLGTGTMAGSTLATGMNYAEIPPTFVQQGMRVAVVVTTMANHTVGLLAAGSYHGGTFFYSLDGAYFIGDLTKDLAVQLWGAEFSASQITIQLNALNLMGGIRNIDLTAKMEVPSACQLVFEVQPFGSSTWLPISPNDPLAPFQSAPVLANLRARFVGSPDIMPGLVLSNSLVLITAPGPAFVFVSQPQTLTTAKQNITVILQVEHFDPVAHTIDCKLYSGSPLTATTHSSITQQLLAAAPSEIDANQGTYRVTATFSISAPVTSFVIYINGTTNSIANVFLVANMVWYSI